MTTETKAARSRSGGSALPRYILQRLITSVLLLIGVTIVTFILTAIVPGDPIAAALGEGARENEATVAAYRERYGLDRPLPERYWIYLVALVQGDLGTSIRTSRPVLEELTVALPATIEVAVASVIVSLAVALVLGTIAAYRAGKLPDQVIRVLSLIGLSVPTFWLAIITYRLFFMDLGWAPGSGRLSPDLNPPPRITGLYLVDFALDGDHVGFIDAAAHLALPVLVLSLFTVGLLTRFIRTSVLEVLSSDYIRAARAKGLPGGRIIGGYLLRGASLPILTMVGIAFGSLLSGTVLVEAIFAWPGLGTYAYNAAINLDLPAVMGVGLVVGVIYVGINLVVDLMYGVLDPRVRLR